MKTTIEQRLSMPERSAAILVRDQELWTYGAKTKKLLRYGGLQARRLTPAAPLPAISAKDVALSWDGSSLLVAECKTRKVFRMDPDSGRETLVLEPGTLDFAGYDNALAVVDAVIGDMAWHAGLLYAAVQAGYSSAIYGIDLETQRVVSHRHAPGPKPTGLDFDPVDGSMYTVDSRNRELRRFPTVGAVDVAELPAELAEPRGLSIAEDRTLWISDWSTDDVVGLKVED
jgi:DNA-binding beta-propeller fold protein YncE